MNDRTINNTSTPNQPSKSLIRYNTVRANQTPTLDIRHRRYPRVLDGGNPLIAKVLATCPRMWYVACWAHWGIREIYYAGFSGENGIPYIWRYNDHNGTADQWELVPLNFDTTGRIVAWTTSKTAAQHIADAMEATHNVRNN